MFAVIEADDPPLQRGIGRGQWRAAVPAAVGWSVDAPMRPFQISDEDHGHAWTFAVIEADDPPRQTWNRSWAMEGCGPRGRGIERGCSYGVLLQIGYEDHGHAWTFAVIEADDPPLPS